MNKKASLKEYIQYDTIFTKSENKQTRKYIVEDTNIYDKQENEWEQSSKEWFPG